jgi:hypothetical protein
MLAGFGGHLLSEHVLELAVSDPRSDTHVSRIPLAALHEWQRRLQSLGPASSLRAMLDVAADPFVRALGFDEGATEIRLERSALVATLRASRRTPVVLVVTVWGERLDPLWRTAIVEASLRQASWCLLFSGTHIRLLDARGVYSRRYAEFDLEVALDDERAFHALWSITSASALADQDSGPSATARLIKASLLQQSSVCRSLRHGVLAASEHLLRALTAGRTVGPIESAFEQALTLVYRMLFLLFAEARSLVPLWHPVYRESYSLEVLCDDAGRQRSTGLWDALRALGRLAHGGCRAGDLRVTPFNGRLFAPSQTPLADRSGLDDEAARQALLGLSTRKAPDGEGRERISYRDLGVEQIGAVYETLLDYVPHVERPATGATPAGRPAVSLRPGSGIRKATGTFYTPQPFAWYLIRRALGPLVRDQTPERILGLKVLDPSMGSGAFLVGACAYLAESYETALVESGRCHARDFGPAERASIRRTIAERCLYGVDLNPMAVQLARLSLWLATLASDRPLSFLDHHLLTGDSLLGTWLTCLRRPPTSRRRSTDHLPLFDGAGVGDAVLEALPIRFTLAQAPNDTPEQVRAKERALAALQSRDTALSKWKQVANLWCAHWFAAELGPSASTFSSLAETILTGASALPSRLAEPILREAARIAAERRFFHWELEFPEVFFDSDGHRGPDAGFDAVVGNPPWDMVRADSDPAARSRRETVSVVRFTRDSGVYTAQSEGHANSYQLFLERAIALARPGGRLGLVLPSGLASDHGSAPLRHLLFSRSAVDALVGFENRKGAFPVHRSLRFLLMTATKGPSTEEIRCRFGETDPSALETEGDETGHADPWFPVRLTPRFLKHVSGPDLAIPNLRTAVDVVISERAAALFAPLGDPSGWNVHFGRELNATDDRDCLQPPGRGLKVVEGRQVEPFKVNLRASRFSVSAQEAERRLGQRHLRRRLAYRDVASATNRVTLIAAVLPAGCVTTHTVFCLRTDLPTRAQFFLCGLFNSLVVNYLARLRVGTHVTTSIVEQLPIPGLVEARASFHEVATLARLLARRDHRERRGRLDALAAMLYQLTESEFAHVLNTFPLVAQEDRDAALRIFRAM